MERPAPSEIPDAPGTYLYRDQHGQVLYVGKAKSLRKRVLSYFNKEVAERTAALIDTARSVDFIVTDNEVEALMLEYSLIQKHKPRFNIRLRDDKSYPFLSITRTDAWPTARVKRGRKKKGDQYFGPYAHAYAIRNTLDLLLKTFPIRTCSDAKFKDHASRQRPCLLFDIEKCSGPCIDAIDRDAYEILVDGLASFLDGDRREVRSQVLSSMRDASGRQDYEAAARYRDRLADLDKAGERQEVVTESAENFDVLAIENEDLDVAVAVLSCETVV